VAQGARVPRQAEGEEGDCEAANDAHTECTTQEHAAYTGAHQAGDDGKEDWQARTICNYLTAAVEECANVHLAACNSEEELTELKDHQIAAILANLEGGVEAWDSSRCPVVSGYKERLAAGTGEEEAEEGAEDDAGDDTEGDEENAEDEETPEDEENTEDSESPEDEENPDDDENPEDDQVSEDDEDENDDEDEAAGETDDDNDESSSSHLMASVTILLACSTLF